MWDISQFTNIMFHEFPETIYTIITFRALVSGVIKLQIQGKIGNFLE